MPFRAFFVAAFLVLIAFTATEVASAAPTTEVSGTLVDQAGAPIVDAWVTDGNSIAYSDADGVFTFKAGTVADDASLTVSAPGFEQRTMTATHGESTTLTAQKIRGIYFNPWKSNSPEGIQYFLDIADSTEVNAVVIDIKEIEVYFSTNVQLFNNAGSVNPLLDLQSLVQTFHDHDIYVIGRLVVFKDTTVAKQNPSLAITSKANGGPWYDMNGEAWTDPSNPTLWDANIELSVEAANMGIDEIQYDYVRFPTDGDTKDLNFPNGNTQKIREDAINGFLGRARDALHSTGTRISADVFGYTLMVEDDLGIGQNVTTLTPLVDAISPMVYPSHWPDGSIAVPGVPNDYPYEVVDISMQRGIGKIGNQHRYKLRPWLQDFDLPGYSHYDTKQVRAQIDAVENLDMGGWLIWSPTNVFHIYAFHPDAATPTAVVPGVVRSRSQSL